MPLGRSVVGAVILLAAGWTVARPADVTGAWKARVTNPRGSFERTFVFKQEGKKLTGHIVSPHGVNDGYQLYLRFEDGVEGVVDLSRHLTFDGVFEPLRDQAYFRQVRADPESGTICWPNGADLDPDVLDSRVSGLPVPMVQNAPV